MGKIPWRRAWQPTPVTLPGESHVRRGWQATVRGVATSWTQLKRLSTQGCLFLWKRGGRSMQRQKKLSTKVNGQLINHSLNSFKFESLSFYNIPNGVLSSFCGEGKQRGRDSLEIPRKRSKKCEGSANKKWSDLLFRAVKSPNLSRTASTVNHMMLPQSREKWVLNAMLALSAENLASWGTLPVSCPEIKVFLRGDF